MVYDINFEVISSTVNVVEICRPTSWNSSQKWM